MIDDPDVSGKVKKPPARNRLKRRNLAMNAKDELISELFERCDQLKREAQQAQKLRLQDLVQKYPEYPQLAEVVRQMGIEVHRERIETNAVSQQLPRSFTWEGAHSRILYSKRFLRELQALAPEHRQHAVFQLGVLVREGPQSPRLKIRRAPREAAELPFNSKLLEVTSNLYVCWRKNTALIIDAIYSPSTE